MLCHSQEWRVEVLITLGAFVTSVPLSPEERGDEVAELNSKIKRVNTVIENTPAA